MLRRRTKNDEQKNREDSLLLCTEVKAPLSQAVFRAAPQLNERLRRQVLLYGRQTLSVISIDSFHVSSDLRVVAQR